MCQEEEVGCPQLCSETKDSNEETEATGGKKEKATFATATYTGVCRAKVFT